MPISNVNQIARFIMSEADEIIVQKKKKKKNQESVVISDHMREDMLGSLLESTMSPELPNLDMIRAKIQNNEYQVDYEKLAESMLELEKLWVD